MQVFCYLFFVLCNILPDSEILKYCSLLYRNINTNPMKKANPFLSLPDSKNIQDLKEIERLINNLEKIHLKIKS